MSSSDDDTIRRAAWIVGHSRIGALVDRALRQSEASIRASRTRTIARRWLSEFQSLPRATRVQCASITFAVALSAHLVLAALLPAAARPVAGLSALALFGAGLAGLAAARITRRGERHVSDA